MKDKYRDCPHCGKETISINTLYEANWDKPVTCSECNQCCNSHRFIIFIFSMGLASIAPILILLLLGNFGLLNGTLACIAVAFFAYIIVSTTIKHLPLVKVLCNEQNQSSNK